MKILRKGPSKGHEVDVECRHCKSLLRVTKSDLRFAKDHRNGSFYGGTCPECGTSFTLFPQHLKGE